MAAAVVELDNTVSDNFIDLKKRLQSAEYSQAEDKHRIRELETEVKQMEELYVHHARLQDARMDAFAAQLPSLNDKFRGATQQQQSGSTDGKYPAVGGIDSYQRIDTVIKLLTEQVEHSGTLQVHEAKVSCHCTHTMINESIKKLAKRMGQLERAVFNVKKRLGGRRTASEGQDSKEGDDGKELAA